MTMNRRILYWAVVALMLSTASIATSPRPWTVADVNAAVQDREDYNSGAYLYRTFCASCHGAGGKGDGPAADLSTPRAPDLTLLQRQAGGVFPRARVRSALEASTKLPGHGPDAMPNWRKVLERTEGARAEERLDALVAHVESLQVK